MNLRIVFAYVVVTLAAACGSSGEPSSSSDEALTKGQKCAAACDMEYTACATTSDPCLCYPQYQSCIKRCRVSGGFDPPEGCNAPPPDASAPPPPPPDASTPTPCPTGQKHCSCTGVNDFCATCHECNMVCPLDVCGL